MIHETAIVSNEAKVASSASIWHWVQVREGASIGENTIVAKSAYIGKDVIIKQNCKIQNNCSIYQGSVIEQGVFIGPHVILTNDKSPRAVNPDLTIKSASNWEISPITIKEGASIGARAVILPGLTIGKWALIGAGSVVTKDVPDHALVYGSPAKIKGKVDKLGNKVEE